MPLFMEFSAKKVNQIFIISKIPVKIIMLRFLIRRENCIANLPMAILS